MKNKENLVIEGPQMGLIDKVQVLAPIVTALAVRRLGNMVGNTLDSAFSRPFGARGRLTWAGLGLATALSGLAVLPESRPSTAYADGNIPAIPPIAWGPDGRAYRNGHFPEPGGVMIFNGRDGVALSTGERFGGKGRPASVGIVSNGKGDNSKADINIKGYELRCDGGISADVEGVGGGNYPQRRDAAAKLFEDVMAQKRQDGPLHEVLLIASIAEDGSLAPLDQISNNMKGDVADDIQPCVPAAPIVPTVAPSPTAKAELAAVATAAPTPIPTATPIQNLLRCGISVPLSALLSEIKSVGYNGPEDAGSVQEAGNRTVNCTPASSLIVAAASVGGAFCPPSETAGMGNPVVITNNGKVTTRIWGGLAKAISGLDLADHPPFSNTLGVGNNDLGDPGAIMSDLDRIPGTNFFDLDNLTAPNLSRTASGLLIWSRNNIPAHRVLRVDAEEACIGLQSRDRKVLVELLQWAPGPGGQAHRTFFGRLPYFDVSTVTLYGPTIPGTQIQVLGVSDTAFASQKAFLDGVGARQLRPNYPVYILDTINYNDQSYEQGTSNGPGQSFRRDYSNYR